MVVKTLCIALGLLGLMAFEAAAQTSTGSYTIRRSTTPDGRTQTQRVEAAPDQTSRMFQRFDVNGDGYIDASEERRGKTQSLDGSQSRAGGLIAFLDRDGDGRVSLSEFRNTGMPSAAAAPRAGGPR